jgi:hypothetical protein
MVIALVLSVVLGFGLTDLIKNGHRLTALALAPVVAATTELSQWKWVVAGAVTGSLVAIAVDSSIAAQTWVQRLRTLVASIGASCAVTPLLVDWREWPLTHEVYFGAAAGLAFISWPILRGLRQFDWTPVIDRFLRRRTGGEQ